MAGWLDPTELRVGLGCMRLEPDQLGPTVAAALAAGITVFDTARAYGDNESRLAGALAGTSARVVTKGGMTRAGTSWVPDGRADALRKDCLASLEALDGVALDLWLLHAPDPKVPWATSLRAVARLLDEGLVPRVGLSNVNRDQLDAALDVLPVTAVQVSLSRVDDVALRGGVVRRCEERGVTVLAHSPLGGPRCVRRDRAQEDLAWVLSQSESIVAIPGARSPEAVQSAVAAQLLVSPPAVAKPPALTGAKVQLVMGIPGAGKTRSTSSSEPVRLNRDERGGTLAGLADELDRLLAAGEQRVVVDSTYLTRAARNRVVETAARQGAVVRCRWHDTPIAQAQINLVRRQLDLVGRLPDPDELKALAKKHPGLMAPTSQLRAVRELEPPTLDEGFVEIERVPFVRAPSTGVPGVFVAGDTAAAYQPVDPSLPHLVFGWQLPDSVRTPPFAAEVASCPHPGGPPTCWCRPPLPGLVLAFCDRRGVDPAASVLVGVTAAHRALADALGARFEGPGVSLPA